ncbi:MAG: DUF4174 domain-containing protein [Tropicimonas sp.]|uniref:DUF4174 domain-containing protein n=1 Tax=Tropicimonas sp. TaxID=2067044 RepID=UPI003A8782FF
MTRIPLTPLLVAAFLALPAPAQEVQEPATLIILPAEDVDLAAFLWTDRVLAVFADTPADPRFIKQMQMIRERPSDLIERDVVVITDTEPGARTAARQALRPRGFTLVLVDKDGEVKLRKPSHWQTRDIARSIDKTPLRLDEIRERSAP